MLNFWFPIIFSKGNVAVMADIQTGKVLKLGVDPAGTKKCFRGRRANLQSDGKFNLLCWEGVCAMRELDNQNPVRGGSSCFRKNPAVHGGSIKILWALGISFLLCSYCYAMGDGVEFDKEVNVNTKGTVSREAIHTEPDTIHVPVWITSNGNIYTHAFEGAVQGTLNVHNNGKPLVLVTNEGKPLVLITNEGKPLITNNGPLLPDNQGKPYILMTNEGKPLVVFDNQGKPLIEIHFDTGALTKTADNAIYIVVTVLGVIMLALCGSLVYYIIRLHTDYHITKKIEK